MTERDDVMRILIAENDRSLAKAILKLLNGVHYSADTVYNAENALIYLASGNYDAAIFSDTLPESGGVSVLKKMRTDGNAIPVLLIGNSSDPDKIANGLNSGADYYLAKPLNENLLLAVLNAMTRSRLETDKKITVGNITLNRSTFELSSDSGDIRLSNREFQIIEILMTHPRQIFSSERFMEKIWGFDTDSKINVVWVYISYLRKKLTALNANIQIKATRNIGYSLESINPETRN